METDSQQIAAALAKLFNSYNSQRRNCTGRRDVNDQPIQWKLSFEEWLSIWIASGKIGLRGKGRDFYCMGRIGDAGDYVVGNVEIISFSENVRRARKTESHSTHLKRVAAGKAMRARLRAQKELAQPAV